jgi:hypothetical protein
MRRKMRAAKQQILFPICILLLMIQAGCGAVGIERESAAEYPITTKEDGPGTSFELKGVANNHHRFGLFGIVVPFVPSWSSGGEDKHKFTLYITISPGTREDVSLDARQVVLLTEGSESISPTEIHGPFNLEHIYDISLPRASAGSFKISKRVAVSLVFPIPPLPPDHKFTLVLNGLSRSGQPSESTKLDFKKQTSIVVTYIYGFLCLHCVPFIDVKWVISK